MAEETVEQQVGWHTGLTKLAVGEVYRMVQRGMCGVVSERVTFVGFTPYPATVIVVDGQQRRLVCGRGCLFDEAQP